MLDFVKRFSESAEIIVGFFFSSLLNELIDIYQILKAFLWFFMEFGFYP